MDRWLEWPRTGPEWRGGTGDGHVPIASGRSARARGLPVAPRDLSRFWSGCLAGAARSGAMAQAPARSGSRFIPNDSDDAERLLRNAANQARDRQWSEALDLYQRVIERYGEKVARLPKGEPGADPADEFVLYMDGRRYCHRRIAQMPPEAREIYRNRIDPMAGRWYREGAAPSRCRAAPAGGGPGVLQLLGRRRASSCSATWRSRTADSARRSRRTASSSPDRADDPFVAGPSRSLGGPGAGRGQEVAVPGRRRTAAEPRRSGGVRPAIPGGDGHASPAGRGLCVDPGRGDRRRSAGDAGPAGRALADLRRLAAADPGRAGADRRRAGAMADRPREGLDGQDGRRRDARRRVARRSRGRRACWPSTRSCWATRCWSATGRRSWPITWATARPARKAARPGRSARRGGTIPTAARSRRRPGPTARSRASRSPPWGTGSMPAWG